MNTGALLFLNTETTTVAELVAAREGDPKSRPVMVSCNVNHSDLLELGIHAIIRTSVVFDKVLQKL